MGPRLSSGIEVLHHLDHHLAAIEQSALGRGACQTPQCLVFWRVEGHGAGLEANTLFEKCCNVGQLGHRQRHRSDRRRTIDASTAVELRHRVVFHDFDIDSVGVADAGASPALPAPWRSQRLTAKSGKPIHGGVEIFDPDSDSGIADVAGSEIRGQQFGERTVELEQFELKPGISAQQPPAGRGRAGQALHVGRQRAAHQCAAAAGR